MYECPDEVSSNQGKLENLVKVSEGPGKVCGLWKSQWLREMSEGHGVYEGLLEVSACLGEEPKGKDL